MNTQEKMLGVVNDNQSKRIIVTHVTIRQSISLLLFRLVVLEVIAAVGVIFFHSLFVSTNIADIANHTVPNFTVFNTPVFILFVLLKTCIMIFIVIQWLNEYHEITPKEIIYRKGLLFKREERNTLEHLGSLEIDQGLLGRIFNYGTIKLFNWATEKDIDLYLIHNPMKYHHILQTLLPDSDRGKRVFREHILEPEEL
jgi:membrane protein YdbS with pleckstrin-like domain